MRKSKYIIILFLFIILTTGCKNNESNNNVDNQSASSSVDVIENSNEEKTINCTREATAKDDIKAELNYQITYQNGYINLLHATEKVLSSNPKNLDEYETAYKNIQKRYNGLEHYTNKIIRTEDSVTNDTTINYQKIDTDKLLKIEGSEDNVIKNGKVKLEDWISFAKKLGVTCK